MAGRYSQSQVTALSNSHSQRVFIEAAPRRLGLDEDTLRVRVGERGDLALRIASGHEQAERAPAAAQLEDALAVDQAGASSSWAAAGARSACSWPDAIRRARSPRSPTRTRSVSSSRPRRRGAASMKTRCECELESAVTWLCE